MADTNNQEALEKAADTAMSEIFIPSFVKQCNERGYPIRNQQELTEALELGAKLNVVMAKVAASVGSPFSTAVKAINKQASDLGVQVEPKAPATNPELSDGVKAALDALADKSNVAA